jgi:nucleoside phosphorylase
LLQFRDGVGTKRARKRLGYGLAVLLIAATERELDGLETTAHRSLVCGVGPVEAAAATARALAETRPSAVLQVGLAGRRGFRGPELVLGSEAIYCDAVGPSLVPARVRPAEELLSAARSAFPEASVCPIGTSARVGGTSGCEVEAMEGFAVLRACELAGVPALEVRAVVNEIDEPDRALWRFDDGFALLREAVPRLLEALDA